MRFLPRFIYSSGIILRGARGDKYRTVTFRNSLATRDAGSAGGVNRGAGEPPGPGPSAGPRRPRRVATSSPRRARRSGVQRTRLSAFPPGPADDARLPAPPGHAHRARPHPRPTRRVRRPTEADRTVERRVALRFVYTLRWAISAEPAELVLGCLLAQGRDNYRNDRAPTRVDVTYWDVRAFSTALCAHLLLKVMLFSGNAPCCH